MNTPSPTPLIPRTQDAATQPLGSETRQSESEQGLLSASARIEPVLDIYSVGDDLVYEITVRWRGGADEISILFPDNLETGNLTPVGPRQELAPSSPSRGRSQAICRYTFRPIASGPAFISRQLVGIERKSGRQMGASDKANVVLPVEQIDILVDEPGKSWGRKGWRIGIGIVALLFAWWILTIVISLISRRKYARADVEDDHNSADERFLSELTTLQLVLIRTNVHGYYDRVFGVVRRVLCARQVIDASHEDPDAVLLELRRRRVDPTYLDCVESILRRCKDVWQRNENPDAAANEKIMKDLRTLIRMRPHLTVGALPEEDEAAEDEEGEDQHPPSQPS